MASMKEVAAQAGVSISTVSHVLNNTRFVAPETVARVQRAMQAVGFHPNAAARQLARGASEVLGLIISDIANPFFPELVKGFESSAQQLGYEITLATTNYDAKRTSTCIERMIMSRVRGVAIMTSEMDPALIQKLRRQRVPVVYLDLGPVDCFASNLKVEYERGIAEAVEHLWALGHAHIGFISGSLLLRSHRQRVDSFRRCASQLGMQASTEVSDPHPEGGEIAARRLLSMAQRPTAIMAANDVMALGAVRAARALGLNIPQDVSIVGHDDVLFAALMHPALTTIEVSRHELGEMAVQALHLMSHAEGSMGEEYNLRSRLVVRESTGPAPGAKAGASGSGSALHRMRVHA